MKAPLWQRCCAVLLIAGGLLLCWYGGGLRAEREAMQWVGFLTGMGGVLWCVLIRLQDRWLPAQPPPGCCRRCGYDLTANRSGVCPECGLPIPQLPRLRQPADSPPR